MPLSERGARNRTVNFVYKITFCLFSDLMRFYCFIINTICNYVYFILFLRKYYTFIIQINQLFIKNIILRYKYIV